MGNPRHNPPSASVSNSVFREISLEAPSPSPGILRGYEDACPGAADRVIAMKERRSKHRQQMRTRMVLGAYVSIHGNSWVGFGLYETF